ncbi:hypothetical protein BC834DRAFT_849257 [Gloeopeniophorella convolvens]|nr:hypothetical protein BC834DRAFT_849257 [Gloeopeniophorella convolvens]
MSSSATPTRKRLSLLLQSSIAAAPFDGPIGKAGRDVLPYFGGRQGSESAGTTGSAMDVQPSVMRSPFSELPSNPSQVSLDNSIAPSRPASLPPTRNELNGKEKQRLLKKARKLSQILGELPPQETSHITQPHLIQSGTPATKRSSRDTLLSHRLGRSIFGNDSHSARSLRLPLAPRSASTNIPSSLLPVQDIPEAGSPSPPSMPTSPRSVQSDHSRANFLDLRRAKSVGSVRSNENTSRVTTLERSPPKSSSRRSPSRARQGLLNDSAKRRSIDSMVTEDAAELARRSGDSSGSTESHRRGMLPWSRKRGSKDSFSHQRHFSDVGSRADVAAYGIQATLSETQRNLGVRRGRKLAQLFGAEPPPAMYTVSAQLEDIPTASSATSGERITTFLTVSSSDLLSVYSSRSSKHRSFSSLSSASVSLPSPEPTADGATTSRRPGSDLPSPAPFSTFATDGDSTALAAATPQTQTGPSDNAYFRQRRLRAAKLSRFFGVGYNDISEPISTTTSQRRAEAEAAASPAEVDIRIQERSWFWNRGESGRDGAHEADLNDVIALLRQMPRA